MKRDSLCLICKKNFYYEDNSSLGKYCSLKCYGISIKGNKLCVGRILSKKTKEKMKLAKKINPIWNKGKKTPYEVRLKQSISQKGKKISEETKKKISLKLTGLRRSEEMREKISGEKHYRWKGGITSINSKIRSSINYRLWKKSVLERDGHACILCKSNKNLEVDHIKRFSDYPELRFDIKNGRVLCKDCHKKTNNYGARREYGDNFSDHTDSLV